jgi:hypothetical protein
MSDLAEQILAAVQADEDEAKRALSAPIGQTQHGIAHCAGHLRRCAADRELVALWRVPDPHGPDDECESCLALRIVARGYGIQP